MLRVWSGPDWSPIQTEHSNRSLWHSLTCRVGAAAKFFQVRAAAYAWLSVIGCWGTPRTFKYNINNKAAIQSIPHLQTPACQGPDLLPSLVQAAEILLPQPRPVPQLRASGLQSFQPRGALPESSPDACCWPWQQPVTAGTHRSVRCAPSAARTCRNKALWLLLVQRASSSSMCLSICR